MCGLASQPTYPVVRKGAPRPIPPPTPGQPPAPPAPPPTPTHGSYGDPYTGPCLADEKPLTITGVPGSICSPSCSPTRVRQAPCQPRSWANLSLSHLHSHRNAINACANLYPFLGQPNTLLARRPVQPMSQPGPAPGPSAHSGRRASPWPRACLPLKVHLY